MILTCIEKTTLGSFANKLRESLKNDILYVIGDDKYDYAVLYYNDVCNIWENISFCAECGMGAHEDCPEPVLFPDTVHSAGTVRIHLYSGHSAGDIWYLHARQNEESLTDSDGNDQLRAAGLCDILLLPLAAI
jgi:hypothetical protein